MSSSPSSGADVLLMTVTPIEGQAILNVFREQYRRGFKRQFVGQNTYHDFGEIGGARVSWVQSGMGSGSLDGSQATADAGIRALSPSTILMVGIAFGVDPIKQKIGDILVSKQLLLYEQQRVGTGPSKEFVIRPRGDRISASPRLVDRFRSGYLDWQGAPIHLGLVLSGEKLVDHVDHRQQLCQLEPEAIGGEMEGAGLYVAAQNHKVDWILVKAISDWADGLKNQEGKAYQQQAAQNAARFVFHVLEQGGFTDYGGDTRGSRSAASNPDTLQASSTQPNEPSSQGKYSVSIQNSQGTYLGDHGQVTMNFDEKPKEQ